MNLQVKPAGLPLCAALLLLLGCSTPESETVSNEPGNYSVVIPPEWTYESKGSNTRVLMSNAVGIVNATVFITTAPTEYSTLEESSFNYVAQLKYEFTDYFRVSDGQTEINGQRAHWHRMKDTDNGNRFETVLYILQPRGKELLLISCSAAEKSFEVFESDFTKIAFSVKVLGN